MIISVELWGLYRVYYIWDDLCYSSESIFMTVFLTACDSMIFKGLFKTKKSDPGYLIPDEDEQIVEIKREKEFWEESSEEEKDDFA